MLKRRATNAVIWSTLDIFIRQGMGFFISILLARLLVPEDFGTIAILSLFTGIATVFVNAGLTSALIQKQDITLADESTVFWFNLCSGMLMTMAIYALAPWIAQFFGLPVLKPLAMVLAFNVLFTACGSVQNALMMKRLDFKALTFIGVVSTLLSGGVGLSMAWLGYGIWALVVQSLLSNLVGMVLLWLLSSWRPALIFDSDSFKRMIGFGGYIFGAGLLDILYRRGYVLLIGKFYGSRELGLYNRAENTQDILKTLLTRAFSKVAFPIMSTINDDTEKLRRAANLAVRSIMFFNAPILISLSVMSASFIQSLFGEQWLPAAPILQVLCISGLTFPMIKINQNILSAQGHARILFRMEGIRSSVGIVFLVAGSYFGVMGIAYAHAINTVIGLILYTQFTHKFINYGLFKQICDCSSSIILGGVAAAVIFYLNTFLQADGILNLVIVFTLGAVFFLLINYMLKVKILRELLAMLRQRRI